MFGSFTKAMQTALRPFVADKHVVDLGHGDGERTLILSTIGVRSVLAIDSKATTVGPQWSNGVRIEYVEAFFADAAERILQLEKPDVAHVAWPTNNSNDGALIKILSGIPCVVYVGCNTDGTACGTPDLFRHLIRRPILSVVRDRKNTMIVYGEISDHVRAQMEIEEIAGLANDDPDRMYSYEGTLFMGGKSVLAPGDLSRGSTLPVVGDPSRCPVPGDVRLKDEKTTELFALVEGVRKWVPFNTGNPERERCVRIVREELALASNAHGVVCLYSDGELAKRIVERIEKESA